MSCFFCEAMRLEPERVISANDLFYALWDGFPVSSGHALIIPRRHVESYFDLLPADVLLLHGLLRKVQSITSERYAPHAFNIGVNDGEAAGRTVHHVHVHIIPRYVGDVEDPRGGVRHIIPGKGFYHAAESRR